MNNATANLEAELQRATAKWQTYEREYILPTFDWAAAAGIDLKALVAANPGRNCVELLITTLRDQRDQLKAASVEATAPESAAMRLAPESAAMRLAHDILSVNPRVKRVMTHREDGADKRVVMGGAHQLIGQDAVFEIATAVLEQHVELKVAALRLRAAQDTVTVWETCAKELANEGMATENTLKTALREACDDLDELMSREGAHDYRTAARLEMHQRLRKLASEMTTVEPSTEPTYPCVRCGCLRTKAEGGTVFTVCDACWDILHPKAKSTLPGTDFNER